MVEYRCATTTGFPTLGPGLTFADNTNKVQFDDYLKVEANGVELKEKDYPNMYRMLRYDLFKRKDKYGK